MKDDHSAKSSTPSKQKRELQTHKDSSQLSEDLETEAWKVNRLRQQARNNPIR